jgi:hypothetical protein
MVGPFQTRAQSAIAIAAAIDGTDNSTTSTGSSSRTEYPARLTPTQRLAVETSSHTGTNTLAA